METVRIDDGPPIGVRAFWHAYGPSGSGTGLSALERPGILRGMERAGFRVELDREEDGRWIADGVDVPGVLVYGATREEALDRAAVLLVRVLADRLEHGVDGWQ